MRRCFDPLDTDLRTVLESDSTTMNPIVAAIAYAEGWDEKGSVPARALNPCDMELGDIGYGVIMAEGGQQITIFPSLAAGIAAGQRQVDLIITGESKAGYGPKMSIKQVGGLWSGSYNGVWADNVAEYLHVSPDSSFKAAAELRSIPS